MNTGQTDTHEARRFPPRPLAGIAIAAISIWAAGCSQPADGVDQVDVVGRVGTQTITLTQVDARAQRDELKIYQELYEARQRALDALIDEHLLAEQAGREGLDADTLMAREVSARAEAVNDSSVQAFYDQNQARMGGQPLAGMRDRLRDYLVAQSSSRVREEYFTRLRQEAGVETYLKPPRAVIEVSANEPARGPVDAPIQLVEYSDFQCPYCARSQSAVAQVMATYGDRVRHVFRDYPLPMHEHAHVAAQAAQCAHDQGQFWEYGAILFANMKALTADDLKRHATAAGLDLPRSSRVWIRAGSATGATRTCVRARPWG